MTQAVPSPLFDPFAPGFTDDPYPRYAALRAEAPVYQHPLGFWLLTRYDDVSWLLRAGLLVEDRNVTDVPFRELRDQMYGDQVPARTVHARPGPARPHPAAPAGVEGVHAAGRSGIAAAMTTGSSRPPSQPHTTSNNSTELDNLYAAGSQAGSSAGRS